MRNRFAPILPAILSLAFLLWAVCAHAQVQEVNPCYQIPSSLNANNVTPGCVPVTPSTPLPIVINGTASATNTFNTGSGNAGYPPGSTPVSNTATGTTAGATATLPGVAGHFTYLCGFTVSPGSATAAITISITTTGLASNWSESVGAPVTAAGTTGLPQRQTFAPDCLVASAQNTAITVVAGALGAGGVNQSVNAWGYQQ